MLSLPPLSLYIHFPWCVKKCPYCDFNSHVLKSDLPEKEYTEALLRDFDGAAEHIKGRSLQSIYLGGGTPSLFSGQSVLNLLNQIRSKVDISQEVEITIEANPESIDSEKLACYQKAGINRISLGIQSLQDIYLTKLGRAHDSFGAFQAIEAVQKAGFKNFNLDLMHSLPEQTEQEGLADIKAALGWDPPHLSWYQLTLEPNTAFYKKPPILPSEDAVADLEFSGNNLLARGGLIPYEISAWSKPGFECGHNSNYWAFGDYIGIGAGAYSKVTQLSENSIMRYWNYASPRKYLSHQLSIEEREVLSTAQLPFEFMLNHLRLYQPVRREVFEARTGLSWEVLIPYCEKAANKGLLEWGDSTLNVTSLGKRFYNDLVTLFL